MVAVSHETHQHQVPPGEVVRPQQETLAVEHLLSEELEDGPLHIEAMEVERQPGMQVVLRTKLPPGLDLDLRLLHGVVLEIRHLLGVQLRDLGHLRGEQHREVVLLHGEVEMEGELLDGETRRLGHLARHGMIRLKLLLRGCGMHRLQGYYPAQIDSNGSRLMQRKHQRIHLPTSMRTMRLRLHLVHNLLRRRGLLALIMHERLDHPILPLHQAMLQQVHSLPCHIFIASLQLRHVIA